MPRSLLAVALCTTLILAHPASGELRAGAAAVDITPTKFPVVVNGGFTARFADKAISPLHARALVLDDGATRIAIVIVDSCILPRQLCDAAKQVAAERTGIAVDRMLVAATHTHSAPSCFGALGTDSDADYPAFLAARIADAIVQAAGRLESAEAGVAVVNADRFTALRRWVLRPDKVRLDPFGNPTVRASMHTAANPDDAVGPTGPEDPDLSVISVRSASGRPIALLANFANHYVGAQPLSPDYFGLFADRIGRAIGVEAAGKDAPPFVGIMSQGTSGDIWLRDYFDPPNPKWRVDIDAYTDGIIEKAAGAYRAIEHRRDLTLAMAEAQVTLRRRTPDAQRLQWARRVVAEMGDRLPKDQPEVYAREAIILHEQPAATLKLQAIRIGDFAITAIPNEVYALTGLKLKAISPLQPTVNIELANGGEGYIPPPEQYVLGGYNTWPARSAGLEPNAEPIIVEHVAKLLEQVAAKPRRIVTPTLGPAAKAVIESKPLRYHRMDEWAAPLAADAIAGRDGSYESGVVYWLEGPAADRFNAPGEVNRSPHFAGGRMKLREPRLADRYSVELWFWNGMVTDARPVTGYLLSRGLDHSGGAAGAAGDHVGLGGTHGGDMRGRLFFYNGDQRKQTLIGPTRIDRWTWHHLVFVRDGRRVRVYLDGKSEIDGEADLTHDPAAVSDLFIGGRCDGFAMWEGRLDEVAVYDRPLSADEAAAHYAAAVPPERAAALEQVPESQPLDPASSIGVTQLRAGYTMQLVAAEPLVADPVAIDWGPDGRMWVAEMADYPLGVDGNGAPGGRVRVLTDDDGDGRYDRSTLFADRLDFPTGVLVWGDGVIVTATTAIVYLEDTDGDGTADVRRPLVTGFTAGNPQLRVNGLRYGLDNWVYIANGLSNAAAVRSERTGATVKIAGRDLRLRPGTGEIDAATGPTQFGRNHDDAGEWFGVDNSNPIWHVVIDDRYLRRNPHAALSDGRRQLITPRNPPVHPISRFIRQYDHPHRGSLMTSCCSTMIYRDGLLFDREAGRGNAFVCEPYHNLVRHIAMSDDGVSYAASFELGGDGKSEFLASADGWFRPVQVRTGPDGALYVVDMYRYLIEHPQYMPEAERSKMAPFYRMGDDRGRIYRVFRRDRPPRRVESLADATTRRLVEELASANGERRDLAQRMLVERGDAAAEPMLRESMRTSGDGRARLHALCTLDGMGRASGDDVRAAIADGDAVVRRHGVRIAESVAKDDAALREAVAKLADDADERVRLQVACTLGEWPDAVSGAALARLLLRDADNDDVRTAVISSLTPHLSAVIAAIEWSDASMPAAAWADVAATAAAGPVTDGGAWYGRVLAIVAGRAGGEPVAAVLGVARRQAAVRQAVAESTDAAVVAGRTRIAERVTAARATAGDATAKAADRAAAIALVGADPFDADANAAALAGLLTVKQDPSIASAAAGALGASGHGTTPTAMLDAWAGAGPQLRGSLLDVLVSRPAWAKALLDALEAGRVYAASIGPMHRERLAASGDKGVKERAGKVFAATANADRRAVVERYRSAATKPGDATRGAAVFAKACATCHRIGEVGVAIGPDLMSVTDRSAGAMLEAVLDPNRAVEPRYMAYAVTTTDGAALLGLIKAEGGASVTIVDASGAERTIPRTQIASMASIGRSLMPEGLEAAMSEAELADLIAFVMRGK